MTTFTAEYPGKSNGALRNKIGALLYKTVVRFLRAHESHAAWSASDYGNKIDGSVQLNRMARKFESSQPSLAAELRYIASRG